MWYHPDPSSHLAIIDLDRKVGRHIFNRQKIGRPRTTPNHSNTLLYCGFILIRPTVWPQCMATNVTDRKDRQTGQRSDSIGRTVFGRPFVKRFALCYKTVVCPICPVCLQRSCTVSKRWTDQDETWQAGRHRPWPHGVRWGPSSPSPERGTAPCHGLVVTGHVLSGHVRHV